jgi:peptide deformylase
MINNLKIVPIEEIPLAVDVPIDDLNKVHEICLQMEEICTKNKGIGLAAVQVGIPWKLFIVDTQQGFQHYVNCEYEPAGEKIKS